MTINTFCTKDQDFTARFHQLLKRGALDMQEVMPRVIEILAEIKQRGEQALLEHIGRFDGWTPKSVEEIFLPQEQMEEAYRGLDSSLRHTLHTAYDRILDFHQKQKPKTWIDCQENGTILGQKVSPVDRAGLYIPGGKAAYPSSLLMNAIPAIVAGVRDIVVCSPTPACEVNALLLAAAHLCGIKTFLRVGGASAIGVMAYGVESLPKVDVISGPGNIYVATAKKLVFGEVNIDMIAGPSEIGIIADSQADPQAIALDLLSQAEHDELASAILITPSATLAQEVVACLQKELPHLCRTKIATQSINDKGAIIITQSLEEAFGLMNEIAPEHLEVMVANPFEWLPFIKHAGAIFLGAYTPEALGDYVAGPNHTLPTGGSAKFFSPLSVEHFMKRSSILSFSPHDSLILAPLCGEFASIEGLEAHQKSMLYRQELSKKR